MIRINLLKSSADEKRLASFEKKPHLLQIKRSGIFLIIFSTVILIIGLVFFLQFQEKLGEIAIFRPKLNKDIDETQFRQEETPSPEDTTSFTKPEFKPKVVLSYAVEEIVKEIEGEFREKTRHTTYQDFRPAAKIHYQNAVCKKALALIKNNTPSGVGFTDIIVTSPGDLYIRGLAGSKGIYQKFISNMEKAASINIKPGIKKASGLRSQSMEFSLYGTFNFRYDGTGGNGVARNREIGKIITGLKKVAQSSGLKLGRINLKSKTHVGIYNRLIYQTHAEKCDFLQFQNFVNKLYISRSNLGLMKFSLRSNGAEYMSATLDLVMYTR